MSEGRGSKQLSDITYIDPRTNRPIEVPPGASLGDRLQQALTCPNFPTDQHIDLRRRRPRWRPALFERVDEEPQP